VILAFGDPQADVALDLLELAELGWHDVYGEITPSDEIIDDLLLCSDGTIEGLIKATRLGLTDWRDLVAWADSKRARHTDPSRGR